MSAVDKPLELCFDFSKYYRIWPTDNVRSLPPIAKEYYLQTWQQKTAIGLSNFSLHYPDRSYWCPRSTSIFRLGWSLTFVCASSDHHQKTKSLCKGHLDNAIYCLLQYIFATTHPNLLILNPMSSPRIPLVPRYPYPPPRRSISIALAHRSGDRLPPE